MTAPQPVYRHRQLMEWLFLLGFLLVFGGFIAYTQYEEYRQIEADERLRLTQQTEIIEKNLVPQIASANKALESVRDDLQQPQTKKGVLSGQNLSRLNQSINQRLKVFSDTLPGVRTLLVVDANGHIGASNNAALVGADLSHRQWFQLAAKNNAPQTLYLIAPIKSLINSYTAALARSVTGPQGEFAGVIYASIHPEFAKVQLESVLYAPDARATMVHGDGILFFMEPERKDLVGKDLAVPGSLFSQHRASGQSVSVMADAAESLHEKRWVAFRSIQPASLGMDKPLVVAVSRDLTAIYAPWRSNLQMHGLIFGVLTLGGMLALYLYQRRHRAMAQLAAEQHQALQASQARQHAIFDASPDAQLISDAQGTIVQANLQVERLLGYTVQELLGQSIELLVPDSAHFTHPKLRDEFTASAQTRRDGHVAVTARRKDGSECDVEISLSRIETAHGTLFVSALRDLTERKKSQERIEELAFFDQLTGLPNRTLLLDRLKQAMAVSERSASYGALLIIDLDNFKTLNDTQGHDAGDVLLRQVAQRLTHCVREGDTVARLGGDEFVVILASLGTDDVEVGTHTKTIAKKILAALGEPYQFGELTYRSTASVGATLFRGSTATMDDLMKQADLAMYRTKEGGRNALCFFDPEMETVVLQRVALEKDLYEAIRSNQFLLHYQAQVGSQGQVTGAEVLVRWLHPQRGMVSPAEFIPLAEETGLILPLGHWVLETACAQLALWATQPFMQHLTVAVNVSAHQFRQSNFVEQVLAVLARTGANPQRLKLELTESMLVANVEEIIAKMIALKAYGIGFSLDDFGTGYSSLSYLKRLPLDQLKIDQSFVRDVLVDPNDAAIAKTIVALAQSLGLGVIAEGVETQVQRDFLATSGCHAYQGFFFSHPLPIERFEAFALQ